MVQKVIIWYK